MRWLWKGAQSAIFWYVSCAPCFAHAYQRKRQKESRQNKLEKEAQEKQQTGVYLHPSPFNTNPYWEEEIVAGPGPPPFKKGHRIKTESSKRLHTGRTESSLGEISADITVATSLEISVDEQSEADALGWNRKKYQRADEMLWGVDDDEELRIVGLSRTTTDGSGIFYTARNPIAGDAYNPVVTNYPARGNDFKWMLQPPPAAKIMEGKTPANRSRSVSNGSYGSALRRSESTTLPKKLPPIPNEEGARVSGGTLKQLPQDRAVTPESRLPAMPGQSHDRDVESRAPTSCSSTASPSRKNRPPPIKISEDIPRKELSRSKTAPTKAALSRPPLSTIHSSSKFTPAVSHLAPESSHATPNTSSSSVLALHELSSPNSSLNARTPSPSKMADVFDFGAADGDLGLPARRSMFPGAETFRFPSTEADEPQKPVRWSMDI